MEKGEKGGRRESRGKKRKEMESLEGEEQGRGGERPQTKFV